MNDLHAQKEKYKVWVTENLGEKTGMWYAPYLEQLGALLAKYKLADGYKHNFFEYQSYSEYKQVYQQMTEGRTRSRENVYRQAFSLCHDGRKR